MVSGWRLATLHGKRAGFPARSRWSATGRNKKAARLVAGFVTLETLSGWGARYPAKKARSAGHGFCAVAANLSGDLEKACGSALFQCKLWVQCQAAAA